MGSVFRRREYKPRKDGKKIDTWHLDMDGRKVEVEVRMLKGRRSEGPKFWVDLPEYEIDIKDTDIEELKRRTIEALKQISPIKWEDVIIIQLQTSGDDDFPQISSDTAQNGTDKDGKQYHRDGPGQTPHSGHAVTGDGKDSWRVQHGFQIVLPKTKENAAFAKAFKDAAGKVIADLATLAGISFNKGEYKHYKLKDEAALKKFVQRGVEIDVKLAKKGK
jgi:hypothetical protein